MQAEVKKIGSYNISALRWGIITMLVLIFCIGAIIIPRNIGGYIDIIKGNIAYNNNVFDDAEVFYRTALKSEPNYTMGLYNLGNAYYRQERYQEAIQVYERALLNNRDKLNISIWNNLGNAYYMQGNLYLSATAYKNALLLNNDDNQIRKNFLFVLSKIDEKNNEVSLNKKDKESAKKNADSKTSDSNKKDEKTDHPQGQPSTNKLSGSEIASLFNTIKQNEQAVGNKINKLRSKSKSNVSDDSEY